MTELLHQNDSRDHAVHYRRYLISAYVVYASLMPPFSFTERNDVYFTMLLLL